MGIGQNVFLVGNVPEDRTKCIALFLLWFVPRSVGAWSPRPRVLSASSTSLWHHLKAWMWVHGLVSWIDPTTKMQLQERIKFKDQGF